MIASTFEHRDLKCHTKVFARRDWPRENCIIYFCGYVTVPLSHPAAMREQECRFSFYCDVHGGISYSSMTDDESAWTFGFDCNHGGDTNDPKSHDYVVAETKRLADQLASMMETHNGPDHR